MDAWATIAAGVVSSLLAIAFLEVYRFARRKLNQRPLRRVLGESKTFGVISPSYPGGNRNTGELGLLTTDNAYALADVIEACRLIGADTFRAPHDNLPSDFPDDQIILGGHVANLLTYTYLQEYCQGIRSHGTGDPSPANSTYYECGDRQFIDTPEHAWSFIIKLAQDVTGQDRTLLILFGRSSFGTAQAAHILRARTSLLPINNAKSFVLAVRTTRSQGYHSPPDAKFLNLTTQALPRARRPRY